MINKNKLISTTAIALVIALLGGTSALAEKAVPGDRLYGVKVMVNEKAAGVFALSGIAQARWQERLVERRLEEAQKVISNDGLDEQTRVALEDKIKTQIDDFDQNVAELTKSEDKDESEDLSELSVRLQASLVAYQNVLEKILGETNISAGTKEEATKFVSAIKESKNKVEDDHKNLELSVGVNSPNTLASADTTAGDHDSAMAKQAAALGVLNSVKLLYQKEKMNLSANIQSQIDSKLAGVESALEEGKTLVTSSDYSNAINKFQLVISGANSTRLLMLSNVIKTNIEEDMNGNDDESVEDGSDDINDDDDSINGNDDNEEFESEKGDKIEHQNRNEDQNEDEFEIED